MTAPTYTPEQLREWADSMKAHGKTHMLLFGVDSAIPLEAIVRDLATAQEALVAMADDGWLMHGAEGMSEAQQLVWNIVEPIVAKRAAHPKEGA